MPGNRKNWNRSGAATGSQPTAPRLRATAGLNLWGARRRAIAPDRWKTVSAIRADISQLPSSANAPGQMGLSRRLHLSRLACGQKCEQAGKTFRMSRTSKLQQDALLA